MSEQREMTLTEWCEKLPDSHLVNKELSKLRARVAELEAARGEPVAWPNRMVSLPCPDGTTDRIIGFRVPEGDPVLGQYGLSEPLAWLRKVTIDRVPTVDVDAISESKIQEGVRGWFNYCTMDRNETEDQGWRNRLRAAIRAIFKAGKAKDR